MNKINTRINRKETHRKAFKLTSARNTTDSSDLAVSCVAHCSFVVLSPMEIHLCSSFWCVRNGVRALPIDLLSACTCSMVNAQCSRSRSMWNGWLDGICLSFGLSNRCPLPSASLSSQTPFEKWQYPSLFIHFYHVLNGNERLFTIVFIFRLIFIS